jgi:hypothetical protein
MRGHRVLPQDPAEAGADLARPDPHVAQLADRRIAVDAVAAGHQAAQVGGHEVSSRDVVGTEGELVPARLDECLVVAPESLAASARSLSMLASSGLARRSVTVVTSSPPRSSSARLARPGRFRSVFGAHGTVLTMPLDDLPDWLPAWCVDQLGDEPVSVLFELRQISAVFGLRLAGGRDVVVKAREDDGRAASCVAAQARLAERGFPCARPLTPVAGVGSLAVHAEEFRPGGEVLHGDSPDVAARYAEAFARLMAELADVTVAPPLPNPPWVRWDHTDSGVWPAIDWLDNRDQSVVPAYVVDTAERARGRILAAGLPCVLGHADFEAQNLRWHGQQVWAVHDWDSLAWQPEAALAGAASGSFASAGPPTLAPIESSEAFLVAYRDIRGRLFTAVEQEIAWAASVWMAAYNAREEALHGHTPVCRDALRAQAAERLRRANA